MKPGSVFFAESWVWSIFFPLETLQASSPPRGGTCQQFRGSSPGELSAVPRYQPRLPYSTSTFHLLYPAVPQVRPPFFYSDSTLLLLPLSLYIASLSLSLPALSASHPARPVLLSHSAALSTEKLSSRVASLSPVFISSSPIITNHSHRRRLTFDAFSNFVYYLVVMSYLFISCFYLSSVRLLILLLSPAATNQYRPFTTYHILSKSLTLCNEKFNPILFLWGLISFLSFHSFILSFIWYFVPLK